MFEGPPFQECWKCRTPNLGVLDIADRSVNRRCRACGWTVSDVLPAVQKTIIYLDQFAISDLTKLRAGTLPTDANSYDFWRRADPEIRRAFLLQQAVFPASPIHFKETNVARNAPDLRVSHEMLSGGVHFRRLEELELSQMVPFAKAFLRGEPPPALSLRTGDALVGTPDVWLSRFHLSVNTDYSSFAPAQRANRDQAAAELVALTQGWGVEKPTFKTVFQRELKAFGDAKIQAVAQAVQRHARAQAANDPLEMFEAAHTPSYVQFLQLAGLFETLGVPRNATFDTVARFWAWPDNARLPFNRLSAYLFAALARKYAAGQKKDPTRGMLNDFEAIAYFGPYVDAMFVDRECGGLVKEMKDDPGLLLRAKVFSPADGDAFIAYLQALSDAASDDVRDQATALYAIA
jgi:hypothetical protein